MRALFGSQLSLESSNPVSKDLLNDELLLVVLGDSQRISANRIVDERAKVTHSDLLA